MLSDLVCGIGHIQRAVIFPERRADIVGIQVWRSDQHQIRCVILLEAGGDLGLLHVVCADAHGGEFHGASGKELALSIGVALPIRGYRGRHNINISAGRILIEREPGIRYGNTLIINLPEGDGVHFVPIDIHVIVADLYAGQEFEVFAAGHAVRQGVAEMTQRIRKHLLCEGGDADLCKLFIGSSVRILLWPDPDDVAGQFSNDIDGFCIFSVGSI